jgi:hypothetical protein
LNSSSQNNKIGSNENLNGRFSRQSRRISHDDINIHLSTPNVSSKVLVEPIVNKGKRNSICAKTSNIFSETEEGDAFLGKKEAFDNLDDSEQISCSRTSSRAKKVNIDAKASGFRFPPQYENKRA